jgi:excisionase family DNA binding protein
MALKSASSETVPRLLTPDDLVSILGITRVQVIRLARAGKIPALKIGKAIRFRATTIDAWLVEQESA